MRSAPRYGTGALLAVVLLAGLGAPSRQASAQSSTGGLPSVEDEVEALSQRLAHLQATYLVPARLSTPYSVDSRLADGRLLFLLGDYGRASIVLLDIVENAPRNTISFYDARFFLAESLFLSRNLTAARGYYEEIVEDHADTYRADAVRRLLEIAFETRHFEGLELLYDELRRTTGTSLRPDIVYIRAKTIYFGGDILGASREFGLIPSDSEYYPQAQYFMATCFVQLDLYDAAIEGFRQSQQTALRLGTDVAEDVANLAAMALGRVYYELDDADSALDAYQSVSRTSRHYDRALFEMTWAYIKAENFHEALRTLEILMLAVPDSRFLPQAQLLRGDLLLRMARYDQAEAIFDGTVQQFSPLQEELAQVLDGESDPDEYFAALFDDGAAGLMLPDIARQWVEDDESMRRALELIGDLESQAREIRESREIIEEIEAVLASGSSVDVFPELRQGYGHGVEIHHDMVALSGRLNDIEADLVLPVASPEARADYAELHQRRVALGQELAVLPQTFGEMEDVESSIEDEIGALETEVYRLSYEIQTQRAQLTAMRAMLREEVERGERTMLEAEQVYAEIDQFERTLDRLEQERDALRRELEAERLSTGIGSLSAAGPLELLRAYERALGREADYLTRLRPPGANDEARRLARIDQSRQRLEGLSTDLVRYFDEIDRSVSQQSADIRRTLDVESSLLDEYDRLLRTYGTQGERLAGEVAFANFIEVQDQFHDLILRADVGIIDVAWRQKEDRTTRIDELFDERNRELRVLDVEFREVLEER